MRKGFWTQLPDQFNGQTSLDSLCLFNNELYAGTYPDGNLIKWDGSTWSTVAPRQSGTTDATVHIYSLCVFNGELYGGMGTGGQLLKWNGTDAWTVLTEHKHGMTDILSLLVLGTSLYAGTDCTPAGTVSHGELWKWNGTSWDTVAPMLGSQTLIYSLVLYNGEIYGGTYPNGYLYKWNGVDAWTLVATNPYPTGAIYSLAVHNNKIYGAGGYFGSRGHLFEWNGVDAWAEVAPQLPGSSYAYRLIEWNNRLFCGTTSTTSGYGGELYRWNEGNDWIKGASQQSGQKSVSSLIVYNGAICGGAVGRLWQYTDAKADSVRVGAGAGVLV